MSLIVLTLVLAGIVGSFLGVVIQRLPYGRSIVVGRSACEACHTPLSPRDMVPIASFVMLRGRCRTCHLPISPFHLYVELVSISVALCVLIAAPPNNLGAVCWGCGLGWTLLALAWIDLKTMRLPDVLTLPLVAAGLINGMLSDAGYPHVLLDRVTAAAVGYLAFRAIALIYQRLRGRDGLGAGDAKLLAAGGAWLGTAMLPYVVMAAALTGIAFVLVRSRGGNANFQSPIPFGPALATAIWIAWLYVQYEDFSV
jgi:leader peptidase (prepilin peptidase)/N-methyltransferase